MEAQDTSSLNISGHIATKRTVTKIQLGTMHGQSLVDSTIVKDRVLTDLNSKNSV